MAKQQEVGRQEGGRWINRPPEPEELAKWVHDNVHVHDGLEIAHYIAGITLIPNKEKVKEVKLDEAGIPQIGEVERMVWTPYSKVETRIAYFWDLMFLHPEWRGKINLVVDHDTVPHLPRGFFQLTGADGAGKPVPFVGASYQVEITTRGRHAEPVIEPPAGTKVVAMNKRGYNGVIAPDENAIHKTQTGGIGRALGFAGMLVVPGSGIATYEDMLEFLSGESPLPGAEPTLPPVDEPPPGANGQHADLPTLIRSHIAILEAEFPQALEESRAWAREKGFDLDHPPDAAQRGLEKQLRDKIARARTQAATTPAQ